MAVSINCGDQTPGEYPVVDDSEVSIDLGSRLAFEYMSPDCAALAVRCARSEAANVKDRDVSRPTRGDTGRRPAHFPIEDRHAPVPNLTTRRSAIRSSAPSHALPRLHQAGRNRHPAGPIAISPGDPHATPNAHTVANSHAGAGADVDSCAVPNTCIPCYDNPNRRARPWTGRDPNLNSCSRTGHSAATGGAISNAGARSRLGSANGAKRHFA